MDFSEGMRQIVLECFPSATITLDRFHMQQLVSDAMQELRLKHKKEEQKFQNEQRKLFKEQLKEKYERSLKRRKKNKKDKRGRKPIRKNKAFVPERLSNGDTIPELLSRSRYPLMVSGEKWTTTQKERISLVRALSRPQRSLFYRKLSTHDIQQSKNDMDFGIREHAEMVREGQGLCQ